MLNELVGCINRWLDIKERELDIREEDSKYYRNRPQEPSAPPPRNSTAGVTPESNVSTSSTLASSVKDETPEPIKPETTENGNTTHLGGITKFEKLKNEANALGVKFKKNISEEGLAKKISKFKKEYPVQVDEADAPVVESVTPEIVREELIKCADLIGREAAIALIPASTGCNDLPEVIASENKDELFRKLYIACRAEISKAEGGE